MTLRAAWEDEMPKIRTNSKKNIKILCIFIFILFSTNLLFSETPVFLTKDGLLKIGKGKSALSIKVDGNAIVNTFVHNKYEYIEIHINPSLEELVKYNSKKNTYEKYYYTKYCINENDDILLELDPPHFGSSDKRYRNFYVNSDLIFEGDIENFDSMKSFESEFRIYFDGKIILLIHKEQNKWKIK
jgi:hypothetical protein